MKKIPRMFVVLVAVCAAFFGNLVPAAAAPAKQQAEPKENWKEVFAEGLFRADGTKVSVSEAFGKKKFVGIYASASWCAPCRYECRHSIYSQSYTEGSDPFRHKLKGREAFA